jgi:Xaa-Pro aminopeptidase
MQEERWDLFVTGNYRTVYYFTGVLTPDIPALLAIGRDGESVLVTSSQDAAAAGEVLPLETQSFHRSITMPLHDAAGLLAGAIRGRYGTSVSHYGVEPAATPSLVQTKLADLWLQACPADATAVLLALRRRKEEDEIDEIRRALCLCAAAYRTARGVIAEGLTEIDVFNAMQAAVNCEAGSSVPLHGDFACGERAIRFGGPPTRREIAAQDLYILDLFPAPALYFADTCRTFAVGTPTDLQQRGWEIVRQAVAMAEAAIKPGVAARDVYASVKEFLDSHEFTENSFFHHLGHGIGHWGHEAPRLIPGSDDRFEVGDTFTLEPGMYTKSLHGGIRLEDNYVVREHGLENLFQFPAEL